ncbi:MAG TPA: ABC transporter permease [Blastocatellia bacterium]|nr:ABC transporter permease [Blastocatellia bacterium]
METLLHDIKYSFRMLSRRLGFTTVAFLTLALGIGANTAIFSIVSAVLLHPYPHIDTDRWAYLWEKPDIEGLSQLSVSTPNYLDWKQQNTAFSDMVLWQPWAYNVSSGSGDPERVRAAVVTPELFSATHLVPAAGRLLEPGDAASSDRLVVISYGLWQRRFGGDPDLPGKKIDLNLVPHTVVGIAPAGFSFPVEFQIDVWTLFPDTALKAGTRDGRGYRVAAILKPGVNFKTAQSELDVISRRLAADYPEDKGFGAIVVPMRESVASNFRSPLLALLGALALVLLLACVNIANLQLVRFEARRKELALRSALGAGRQRLIRQLTTESLVLVLGSAAIGVLFAPEIVRLVLSLVPPDQAPWLTAKTDLGVLLAATGLTLVTALLAGLLPAIKASRFDLRSTLASGGSITGSAGVSRRLRGALLVAELALAIIPLAGTSLMVQTFLRMAHVDPGFKADHRLTLSFSAPAARYAGPEKLQALAERVQSEVHQVPGVRDDGLIQYLPFGSAPGWLQALTRQDPKSIPNAADLPHVRYMVASTGYIEAMGIPVDRGRTFADSDSKDSLPVAVINESLARKYFPDEDPIGKQIWAGHAQLLASLAPRTIVGVIGDHLLNSLDSQPSPAVWVPISQQGFSDSVWRTLYLVVNTDTDPHSLASSIRRQIAKVDSQLALTDMLTMEERLGSSLWRQRFMAIAIGALSFCAVAIAMLGVFGVSSYLVSQRTREIGVRIALGAQATDIFRMVIAEGFWLVLNGIAVGALGAFGLARLISGLLFGVAPADPLTFAAAPALLGLLALLASYLPARRAAAVDPLVAFKIEEG